MQRVIPFTFIITDGWASYADLDKLEGGIYKHEVIIHKQNFVHPENKEIHTQNIENLWMRAKLKIRKQYGADKRKLAEYLSEAMWREFFRQEDKFQAIIYTLSKLLKI